MTGRRLAPLILLIALMLAPIGRMGLAEAAAMPAHAAPMAMAGHCDDAPAPGKAGKTAVDCALACAAIAAPVTLTPQPAAQVRAPHMPFLPAAFAGIRLTAEPPPPRRS